MIRSYVRAAVPAAVLALAACSQDQAADNQNMAQPAGEQQSAQMNEMMNDPSNPYAQAEMQMNERMMAAVGVDVPDSWVKKMIEHHRGAIDMSNVVLAQGQDPRVREMAQKTIQMQTKDIQDLEKLRREGAPSQQAADAFRQSMMQMHERMMDAKGADASETWTRKMIEHHRGALDMSNIVLAEGATGQVREMAQMTIRKQTKDISDLEKMLAGESPEAVPAAEKAAAAPAPAAKASAEKAAPTKPASSAAARPKAAAQPKAKAAEPAAANPHAGHDMNNM